MNIAQKNVRSFLRNDKLLYASMYTPGKSVFRKYILPFYIISKNQYVKLARCPKKTVFMNYRVLTRKILYI